MKRSNGDVVLVTGGAGYVGSAMLGELALRRAVRTCDTHWFVPGTGGGGTDHRTLRSSDLDDVDTIIHLADPSSAEIVEAFPEMAEVADTARLAQSARSAGVRRFVFASTAAVYNDGHAPATEASPVHTASAYSRHKYETEQVLKSLADDDFEVVVCRLASCFGWSPALRPELVINRMSLRAFAGECLSLSSDGTSWRPFVHVADAGRAFIHAATALDPAPFRVFNVCGTDGNRRVADALDAVADGAREFGLDVEVGTPEDVRDPRSYTIDASAFAKAGFVPSWSIDEGITDLLRRLGSVHGAAVPVERLERLRALRATGALGMVAPGATASSTPGSVTPYRLPRAAAAVVSKEHDRVMSRSRYRLGGGHAEQAEALLADALCLPDSWGVIGLRSGTDALTRSLWLAGVRPGSRVAVPDVAFHAVAATVVTLGAEPVFVDVTSDTWNLDPEDLRRRRRDGPIDAVIAVDNYGTPADLVGLRAACGHEVPIVLDACESLGAGRSGPPVAEVVDYVAMSFSFTKPIHAAGMGGALCAPVADLERAESSPELLIRQTRLPELNAAYLVHAWSDLPRNLERLRSIYDRYSQVLRVHGFDAQAEDGRSTRIHAPFLVPRSRVRDRDGLVDALVAAGVAATTQFPSQSRLLGRGTPPPVAAEVDARVVSFPTGAGLCEPAIDELLANVKDVVARWVALKPTSG